MTRRTERLTTWLLGAGVLAASGCAGGRPGGGGGPDPNLNAVGVENANTNSSLDANANLPPDGNANVDVNQNQNTNENANQNADDPIVVTDPPGAALAAEPGEPLPTLAATERDRFEQGKVLFEHQWTATDGLGPQFSAASCRACHDQAASGGGGERFRNVYFVARTNEDGTLAMSYGTFFLPSYGPSEVFPSYPGDDHPPVPSSADVVAQRNPPPLFGIGLFELIADETILARSDPDDADGDGISGIANVVGGRMGHFGYKAQGATLADFTRGTLQEHCGLTSDPLPPTASARPMAPRRRLARAIDALLSFFSVAKEAQAQIISPGQPTSGDGDDVPEPEIGESDLRNLIAFQQYLAPPRRGPITASMQRGEAVFNDIGCNLCHVAGTETSLGTIYPYTDLLLHDMGPDLADGVVQGSAGGDEFRTAPLWALCRSAPYLHDGRGDTIDEAITAHGGEAADARDRFTALDQTQREELLKFLNSL